MANAIYFVKSGELSFHSTNDDGEKVRVFKTTKGKEISMKSMLADCFLSLLGTFVGETSLFLGIAYDMSVEAEEDSTVYEITKQSFKKMDREAPFLARALHTAMLQSLSLTVHIFMKRLQ
jgi:CRP-like cAMP-binding protein